MQLQKNRMTLLPNKESTKPEGIRSDKDKAVRHRLPWTLPTYFSSFFFWKQSEKKSVLIVAELTMIRNDSSNMFQDILNSEEAEEESIETKKGILLHWQKFNYSISLYFWCKYDKTLTGIQNWKLIVAGV